MTSVRLGRTLLAASRPETLQEPGALVLKQALEKTAGKAAKGCAMQATPCRFALFAIVALGITTACSRDTDQANDQEAASTYQQAQPSCLCAPQIARNVGAILVRSNPISEMNQGSFDEFRALIQSNANVLQDGSPIVTCAGKLGSALTSIGLATFSRRSYDDAYGSVINQGGTIAQAQQVADSMNSGSLDAHTTGEELSWLSTVLPAAANGDWTPYMTTATERRAQIRQVLPLVASVPDMAESMPIVQAAMTEFGPLVEEQMVMAACLYRR